MSREEAEADAGIILMPDRSHLGSAFCIVETFISTSDNVR
jgi:hypothetical protein